MSKHRSYWASLKDHPGVPVAIFMTLAGFLAGIDRGFWFACFSACFIAGWCWGLVLWSNRSRE